MPRSFGQLLLEHLQRRDISLREFAKQVEYDPTNISKMVHQARKPPLKRMEQWCDSLGLRGNDREEFLDAAHLAAATPRVRSLVERLEKRAELLQRRQARGKQPKGASSG